MKRIMIASMLAGLLPPAMHSGDVTRVTAVSGGGYFPVLIRLHSGELMAVLRGGAPHVGVKGRLDIVTSKDGGKTWSAPRTVADGPDDDRNPALGQLKDGTILLSYAIARGYDESGTKFAGSTRKERIFDGVYVIRSSDQGKTWSEPQRSEAIYSFYRDKGYVSPYGKIIQLANGTALMSVYFEFFDGRGNEVYLYRSHDTGKTWGEPSLVGKHYNETAFVALPGGELLAAMRSEKGGNVATTISRDQGRTWSDPVQITQDHEHPADLIVLKGGAVLLTFGERNKPYGVHALVSRDRAKSWDMARQVTLADDAVVTDCGYPSSVQLPDGRIVTMWYQVDDPKNALASSKAKVAIWTVGGK
jgi:hypothetical protein